MVNNFKKDKSKIRSFNWYLYVINGKKGIREGIFHTSHRYTKAYDKYKNDYDKNKELSYLKYCDVNNSYGWAMLQKLRVNNFEWIKDASKFNEVFIKKLNEESGERCFL